EPALTTLSDVAATLRYLRRREARTRHGRELTYGQIAAKTGWSIGIIGGYLTGTAMPPTDRFDVLIQLFGATRSEQSALVAARDRVVDAKFASKSDGPTAAPGRPGQRRR